MSEMIIERKIFIEAKPGIIFSYFTESDKLCQWLGQQASLEAVETGRIQIDMNGHDIVIGAFEAIEPFERIVFTWGWAGSVIHPPGSSKVEVTLTPDANGTWLCLSHSSVPESEQECHLDGWVQNLPQLRAVIMDKTIGRGA